MNNADHSAWPGPSYKYYVPRAADEPPTYTPIANVPADLSWGPSVSMSTPERVRIWEEAQAAETGQYNHPNGDHQPSPAVVDKIVTVVKEVPQKVEWEDVDGIDYCANDDGTEGRACVICLEKRRQCVLLPCMHLCLCISCANSLKQKKICPICGQSILTPKKIFEP